MKRLIYLLAVFAALTANSAMAQYNRDQVISRTYEPGVYNDDRGEYRWQVIERRVWIPEYRTRGILGVGSRTIPGHYEMRTDRVKVIQTQETVITMILGKAEKETILMECLRDNVKSNSVTETTIRLGSDKKAF